MPAPSIPPGSPRPGRPGFWSCAIRVPALGFALMLLPSAGEAQNWTFRPVFTLGAGYDSNVVFTPGDTSPGDYFGGVGLRAPLSGKIGRNSSLTASYSANGEWYRDLSVFDAFPSRQNGALSFSHAEGEAWSFGLNASYGESRRPEDLFPQAGTGYVRGQTRNFGAGANYARKVGEKTGMDLGYAYGRPFYEPLGQEAFRERQAQSHSAHASLERHLSRTSRLSVRYLYSLYLREGEPDDESHVIGLGYGIGLGRNTTLSLFAGARLEQGAVRPDVNASLARAWRSSQVTLSYSKTRNYLPTTGGFTETDFVNANYTFAQRRFRLTLGGGYSRNQPEARSAADLARTFESWRGSLDTVYKLSRWLGLGATYQYDWQYSGDARFDDRTRHLVQAGIVIEPWTDRVPRGLR